MAVTSLIERTIFDQKTACGDNIGPGSYEYNTSKKVEMKRPVPHSASNEKRYGFGSACPKLEHDSKFTPAPT